ncbi:hypothetical protein TBLA_0E03620 [Henningerozyma blattae CBS 6284]|uniref:Actin cytoskeleton-regulatory complex protein END3 n=1 Tax=Henningerozyma blattae (strain ATCC 34711 / CBS 6284 / DSM 70876 / NBRC 10599 / NRRL Y-10934 / UCD 77-7) TaxID=1071380 RepID=I2H4W4_HENB6|nr:hypothetical protein TBLA_0E03620 [Tetrapisispora blattae CBS 6284]CCH61416.1 hypothetical protein TBLA_0E03620 [Tetrapisispora blattae CBS 6284]
MPQLEPAEIKKYWQIFGSLKPVDNKVDHDQVSPILYNSKLDSSILNKIWFLADIDDDDNLDFEEFVICMRFIYDLVNKNIDSIPDELPKWLIPGSKGKLVKERIKRKRQENADIPKIETPEVDWYISSENKNSYQQILASIHSTSSTNSYQFKELSELLKTKFFNVGGSDLEKIWKLINTQNNDSIDGELALFFIHILKQRNDVGCKIPTHLPKNFAELCNNQKNNYNLGLSTNSNTGATSLQTQTTMTSISTANNNSSTPNTPVSGTPQEQITQLEQELENLEKQLEDVIQANKTREELEKNNNQKDNSDILRQQFEGLLNYRKQLVTLVNTPTNNNSPLDISSLNSEMATIEQQVQVLQNYLSGRKNELNNLKIQVNSIGR